MCSICSSSSNKHHCGICKSGICKSCTFFLDSDRLQYMPVKPEYLNYLTYCLSCYNLKIGPEIENYDQLVTQAEQVSVFMKDQSKETRLMSRKNKIIEIGECADEQDVILKLAFQTNLLKFNGLIDVEIFPKKVKTGSYSTTVYSGKGRPVKIDVKHIIKDRSIWQNPN